MGDRCGGGSPLGSKRIRLVKGRAELRALREGRIVRSRLRCKQRSVVLAGPSGLIIGTAINWF